jgi:transcriptional regulator with XRE-family HTH domain
MTGDPGSRPRSLSLAPTSPSPVTELGPALVAAREADGLTQDDVAAALGTSRQAVGYWEQGKRTPRPDQMLQLAALFRTTVADLLAMPGETPQRGVQTAAMLWRKSGVQLDETARDGIEAFTDFLDFYASLASKMRRNTAGMTRSPFLPGAGYGEYAVDARRKASEVQASAKHSASPSTGPTSAAT